MPLDLSRPMQTKDGRPVRDVKPVKMSHYAGLPIVGAPVDGISGVIVERDGAERLDYWWEDGTVPGLPGYSPDDLMNVPEERSGWVNVWDGGKVVSCIYSTKEDADKGGGLAGREACIEVKYRPGQGLGGW